MSESRVITPDQIVVPSFTIRSADSVWGVVRNAGWTLEHYAQEIKSWNVEGIGMMWENVNAHLSPAQRQLHDGKFDHNLVDPILVAGKENSRSETTLGEIFVSPRAPFNALYAYLQPSRFTATADRMTVWSYQSIKALHPNMMIPFRVYGANTETATETEGVIHNPNMPSKIYAFGMRDILPGAEQYMVARAQDLSQNIWTEGLDLNIRDVFAYLPPHVAMQFIEEMLKANSVFDDEDKALVQMVTIEPNRALDQQGNLSLGSEKEALEIVRQHFKGTIVVSPGGGHVKEDVQYVAKVLRE